MGKKVHTPEMDQLMKGILCLETVEECYAFFEDICTASELLAIAQRLEVAKMLSHDIKYREIGEKTGASSATISRVARALRYGEEGYNLVLERLKEE